MIDEPKTLKLSGGMDVFGSDGEKVGSIEGVEGVEGDYVIVSKGFFFPTDYYIPMSAFNTVVDGEGAYLNVTRDDAVNHGWDTAPAERTTTDTADGQVPGYGTSQATASRGETKDGPLLLNQHTGYVTGGDSNPKETTMAQAGDSEELSLLNRETGYVTGSDSAPKAARESTASTGDDTIRIGLSEEELTAQTRDVERGHVSIDKKVTAHEQGLDVPVTEEQVTVTRRTVDRDLAPGETSLEEGTIDIPIKGQDVDVSKRAHVVEELEISRDQVQDTRHVTDKVRREEARIRDESGNVIENVADTAKKTAKGKGKRS